MLKRLLCKHINVDHLFSIILHSKINNKNANISFKVFINKSIMSLESFWYLIISMHLFSVPIMQRPVKWHLCSCFCTVYQQYSFYMMGRLILNKSKILPKCACVFNSTRKRHFSQIAEMFQKILFLVFRNTSSDLPWCQKYFMFKRARLQLQLQNSC